MKYLLEVRNMEFKLNSKESVTLLEMAQDCIDKGMVTSNYETDTLEDVIEYMTNDFGEIINKNIKITIEFK